MKKEIPHVLRVTPAQKGKLPLGMLVVRVVKSLRRVLMEALHLANNPFLLLPRRSMGD